MQKDNTKGTNTLFFIRQTQLPENTKPTYFCIWTHFWPQKEDPYRVGFTVRVNRINCQGETYTPTADLTTAKFLLNIIISTNRARFICIDLSNFDLITPFNKKSDYEYVWIPEWVIPEDIME